MAQHQELLSELDQLVSQFEEEADDPVAQRKLLAKMQLPLIASQDIGDSKIQIVQSITDTIENKMRQLEHDSQNLDFGRGEEEEDKSPVKKEKIEKDKHSGGKRRKNKEEPIKEEQEAVNTAPVKISTPTGKNVKKTSSSTKGNKQIPVGPTATTEKTNNIITTGVTTTTTGGTLINKRSHKKGAPTDNKDNTTNPPDLTNVDIDPDEPTYCLCDQVSYGEMIGCDNDLCPIEWFHFNCVQLSGKPKGKWFCPKCRGDKPTIMKPKAQFLKELEKYNKEKEDKVKS